MTDIAAAPRNDRISFDMYMVAVTAALVGVGIVAVFSASFARAALVSNDSFYKVKPQVLAAVAGALAMLITARLKMERVRELAYWALGAAGLGLVLVLWLGVEINGARRWFAIGSFHLQPSEFAKLAVIIAAARFAVESPRVIRTLKGLTWPIGVAFVVALLIVAEHDLGTAMVVMTIALLLCHFGGARARDLGLFVAVGLACVVAAIFAEPYRLDRWRSYFHPKETALTTGYQIHHSVIALGAGGLVGRGLGEGREKYSYLPAAETDCIFAVIGEEMGLFGTWGLLALFAFLVWRGIAASLRVGDPFCVLVGAGVTSLIAIQVIINVAVVTGLVPAKGAPLPFISYGGSSLVFGMAAVGLLLNVSRQPARGRTATEARDSRHAVKASG